MSDNTPKVPQPSEEATTVDENTKMAKTKTQPKTAEKNLFLVREENRLTAFQRTDGVWDPMHDLYVKNLVAARAVLDGIGAYLTGVITGNEHLFFVAPTEKFAYENGSGTMAYVSADYVPGIDDVTIQTSQGAMLAYVDPRDVPAEGYRRLHIVQGKLTSFLWEPVYTARGQESQNGDNSFFHRLWAESCLLAGHTVSVSVGSLLAERADQIMAVYNSDDPAAADAARRQANRAAARIGRDAKQNANSEQADVLAAAATADEYMVPLFSGGKTSLAQWPYETPIKLRNEAGINMISRVLKKIGPDTPGTRLMAAQAINAEEGVFVVL